MKLPSSVRREEDRTCAFQDYEDYSGSIYGCRLTKDDYGSMLKCQPDICPLYIIATAFKDMDYIALGKDVAEEIVE